MKTKTLRIAVGLLIGMALFFGFDLPRFLLPGWSPLARTALDAAGQLLAYAGMAALALLTDTLRGGNDHINYL